MSNDAKNNNNNNNNNNTVDVDVLLKKGIIAGRIMTDSNATKDQKIRAGKSLSESFLANKQVDSPSSSSCGSDVDWSQVVQLSSASAFVENTTKLIEERQTKEREAWAEQIATQVTNRVSNNVNTHTTGEHETTRALANKGFQDIGNKVDAATEKLEAQVAATEKLGAQVIDEIKEFIIQASAQKLTRPGEHSAFGAPPVDTVTLATHDSSAATPFDMEKDEKIASLQNQVKELQHSATKKRLFEDPSKEEEEEEEEAGVPMMKRWKRFGSKIAFGGGKK